MPSKWTFSIKPIKSLLSRYVINPKLWTDPFSGMFSPASVTNDIDPETPAKSHQDSREFLKSLEIIRNCLLDPPYSPRQISECYKKIGKKVTAVDTQSAKLYSEVKDLIAERMPIGGIVISCGWNSNGMGINRGYSIKEILLVAHGGAHNDTIIMVEEKVRPFYEELR